MRARTLSRPPIPSLVKSQSLLIMDCVAAFLRGKNQKSQSVLIFFIPVLKPVYQPASC